MWQRLGTVLHGHLGSRAAWRDFGIAFQSAFNATDAGVKLLVMLAYLSVSTTLTPLPTGWIVAGVATREAAIAGDLWSVTLIVALVGAAGSTIANLNDYYAWTWLLRSRRVAKVRTARWYATAARWFDRAPSRC